MRKVTDMQKKMNISNNVCLKIEYISLSQAKKATKRLKASPEYSHKNNSLHAYYCDKCGYFHMGHNR